MYADTLLVAESHRPSTEKTTGPTGPGQATRGHRVTVADDRIVGAVVRWAAGLKTVWVRRKTIAHLSALDDRLLADIGIERSQIGTAVEGVLRAAKTGATAATSAARGLTDGAGPPAINDNGPEATDDNGPEVEDSFEAVARQWRDRRPAKATGGQPD